MDTGSSLTNLDKFVSGRYAAEAHGSKLTHWLMKPATAETLSLLKKLTTGSNESLISFVEDGLRIAGVPVITSTTSMRTPSRGVWTPRSSGTWSARAPRSSGSPASPTTGSGFVRSPGCRGVTRIPLA